MLRFDGEYLAGHPKAIFGQVLVKNRKQSVAKRSIEKYILFNFVSLSTTFCPRLQLPLKKTEKRY